MSSPFLWNYISCKYRRLFDLHRPIWAGVLHKTSCRWRISGTFGRWLDLQLRPRLPQLLGSSWLESCWSELYTLLPFARRLKEIWLRLRWSLSEFWNSPDGSKSLEQRKQVTPPWDFSGGRIDPQLGQKPGVTLTWFSMNISLFFKSHVARSWLLACLTITKHRATQISEGIFSG